MKAIDDSILARAVAFMIELDSGLASAQARQACDAWRKSAPEHEQAWQAVEQRLSRCSSELRKLAHPLAAGEHDLREILTQRQRSRRVLLGLPIALAGAAAGSSIALDRVTPVSLLLTGYSSGTGRRSTHMLPDGSTMLLDARSGADFTADSVRHLQLRAGQALISPASGATPFRASTAHCTVHPQGAERRAFMLRHTSTATLAVALEQPLSIRRGAEPAFPLEQGLGCWIRPDGIQVLSREHASAEAAWRHGHLEILDQSLASVIDALRAYRYGYLRLSPRAADLRVQGVLPLDDTDAALDTLAEILPLRLERRTRWYVSIDLRPPKRNKT